MVLAVAVVVTVCSVGGLFSPRALLFLHPLVFPRFPEIASEGLKGRVFELSLSDLNGGDEAQSYRKIRLVCEDVQGTDVVTNFHGMDMTRDKLCSLIRKWQSLIEAFVDVRTTDGYYLRIFAIAFTKKQSNQAVKSTCYAQAGQIRNIRKKMFEILTDEATKCDLKELVQKLYVSHVLFSLSRPALCLLPLLFSVVGSISHAVLSATDPTLYQWWGISTAIDCRQQ